MLFFRLFLDVKDPYSLHIFLNHFTKNPILQKEVKEEMTKQGDA